MRNIWATTGPGVKGRKNAASTFRKARGLSRGS